MARSWQCEPSMLNTIVQMVRLAALLHGADVAFVDRVEDNHMAVVCVVDTCANVRTTAHRGGLREGTTVRATEATTDCAVY